MNKCTWNTKKFWPLDKWKSSDETGPWCVWGLGQKYRTKWLFTQYLLHCDLALLGRKTRWSKKPQSAGTVVRQPNPQLDTTTVMQGMSSGRMEAFAGIYHIGVSIRTCLGHHKKVRLFYLLFWPGNEKLAEYWLQAVGGFIMHANRKRRCTELGERVRWTCRLKTHSERDVFGWAWSVWFMAVTGKSSNNSLPRYS